MGLSTNAMIRQIIENDMANHGRTKAYAGNYGISIFETILILVCCEIFAIYRSLLIIYQPQLVIGLQLLSLKSILYSSYYSRYIVISDYIPSYQV